MGNAEVDLAAAPAKNEDMKREEVIAKMRAVAPELRANGVVSLSVFGSAARDEAGPNSDIDVAVRLSEDFSRGGFDYFERLETLERRLMLVLGRHVEVIEEPVRKERFQHEIDRDRAVAF